MCKEPKTQTHQDPARLRRCLICGCNFPSEGPHNRICRKCKNSQAWRQG
ncbi:MAG: hypothetical protein ACE5KF_01010 [Kiloniellaceae bacterium]